jgi:hypothetical protein
LAVTVQDAPNDTVVLDVVESSAMAQSLEAPDYALDASGLSVTTDVHNIVQSVTGGATLTAGLVPGDGYIVVEAAGLDTYAELDGAYLAGEEQAVVPSIPAADFALVGDDLGTLQKRTLIVADAASGVRSYQAFEITFHASP